MKLQKERTQMKSIAAYMLVCTEKSILEIAAEHGYDNGSKFSSAFRQIKGMNPTAYRTKWMESCKESVVSFVPVKS